MIPDDLIDKYLDSLFGTSEPGDIIHHLLLATAEPGDHDALGLPDLKVAFYAIAPDRTVPAGKFVAQTIVAAVEEARREEKRIYFAGLAVEVHSVVEDGNEVTENLARRLQRDRKLQEHPAAVEKTVLYAACRDGRRWTGEHILTGPEAGTISGPQTRVGALGPEEAGLQPYLIRAAVGLTPAHQKRSDS